MVHRDGLFKLPYSITVTEKNIFFPVMVAATEIFVKSHKVE